MDVATDGSFAAVTRQSPPIWNDWERKQGRIADQVNSLLITPPRWLLWLVRTLPAPRLRFTFVGRYDEVIDVLNRPDVFRVPFDREIARLNDGGKGDGTPFLLGIDAREAHDEQLVRVMHAFPRDDIASRVAPLAFEAAAACVDDATWPFDAIGGLITRTALRICTDYFGVPIGDDPRKFAYATFTTSNHLFGPPPIEPDANADASTAYFRHFVDQAIAREENAPSGDSTIVARLVRQLTNADGRLQPDDRHQIRAFLMGMIVAFVPNNTLAGGHILEVLLDRPEELDDAEHAACTGDDARLECVLFEALRFKPLNPGPFRIAAKDYVLAEGTSYARRIREGSIVMPMTFAAMFDPRRVTDPRRFDPTRPKSDHLHFGYGMHSCVGIVIARVHLVQTFKALLLRRRHIERDSRMRLRGVVPVEMKIRSSDRAPSHGAVRDARRPAS